MDEFDSDSLQHYDNDDDYDETQNMSIAIDRIKRFMIFVKQKIFSSLFVKKNKPIHEELELSG